MEVCSQHLHQTPTPPSIRVSREVPRDLERVALRCLEKKPEARFQSVTELRDALRACQIEPWTADDARRWWDEHPLSSAPARVDGEVTTETQAGVSPTAVTVDVRERMTAEIRSGVRTA